MFSIIRTAIIDKLNSPAVTKIQNAYRTDRSSFEGFPAAMVSPSENESDYSSTADDKRHYVFKIRVYYPLKDDANQEAAELALEEAIDELLDVFNERGALGSACDWVTPVPSAWQYEERGDGVYRLAELTLKCAKYSPNR